MNIIVKTKGYLRKIIGKENIEFISHAKNYMSAEFFTKAIGFILSLIHISEPTRPY